MPVRPAADGFHETQHPAVDLVRVVDLGTVTGDGDEPGPRATIEALLTTSMPVDEGSRTFDEREEPWGMIAGQRHWHRLRVPVTIFQGDLECIDLRPGPGQGRLGMVPHDGPGNFDEAAAWPSLGAYLETFTDVLTTGLMPDPPPFDTPYADPDGNLRWG